MKIRLESLKKRLAELEEHFAPWIDNDIDGFLAATGALPGESAYEVLERQTAVVWSDYGREEARE